MQLPTLESGKLQAYAFPGGYPLLYLDGHNSILCPDCANNSLDDPDKKFRPQHYCIYYEGEAVSCEQCNTTVESAYGETIQ